MTFSRKILNEVDINKMFDTMKEDPTIEELIKDDCGETFTIDIINVLECHTNSSNKTVYYIDTTRAIRKILKK